MSLRALNDLLYIFESHETGLEEKLPRLLRIFRDELPEESRARINSIPDLFDELKDCCVIHIDNLRPLKEALGLVGRQDLVENIEELERQRAEQTGPLQRYGASLQSNVRGKSARILSSAKWAGEKVLGALNLHCNFRTIGGGVVVVGAVVILRRCTSVQEFVTAFTGAVLPAANTLRAISDGSVCFKVQAENLSALQVLWQQYQDDTLQKNLQDFLITEEINQLADGQEVMVNVNIDEQEYKEACLDMMITETKDLQKEPLSQRLRRNSDSILDCRSRDTDEPLRQLRKRQLSESEAKEKHSSRDQGEDMEPERLAYVQIYLEKLQETHSVTSETTDSGLATYSAPSEDSDVSDEPRCKDLTYDVIKELSRRLQNDEEAWSNVCEALQLTSLGREALTLKKVISFFPATPVRLLKDVFDALQLHDLVQLLEKVKVNHSSLLLQGTLQEVRTLRKTDERPTTYHTNVAVLIVYDPKNRAEITEGIRTFFMDLNSDNDVTSIPGLRRYERKGTREQLSWLRKRSHEELRKHRMRWEKEWNETEITEKAALETVERWIQNQGRFTFFVVLDFAGNLSEFKFMMEKLETLSHKAKLILTSNDWTTLRTFPETLLLSFSLFVGPLPRVIPDAVGKILKKCWQTLDLCSMMEEMRRTVRRTVGGKIQITDNMSCKVKFKKLENKDSA